MAPESLTDHGARRALELVWSDGAHRLFSYDHLRAACPCAACRVQRDHGGSAAPRAADLHIRELRPVGSYGMQIVFSDGHDRGIYPWVVLRDWPDA